MTVRTLPKSLRLHVLPAEGEVQLPEGLLLQRLPVVHLLGHGLRAAVVVQLHQPREVVLHQLRHEDAHLRAVPGSA